MIDMFKQYFDILQTKILIFTDQILGYPELCQFYWTIMVMNINYTDLF